MTAHTAPEARTKADLLSIYRADFPITEGRTVCQGHADACELWGHASYKVDGVDQGYCPRCGENTDRTYTDRLAAAKAATVAPAEAEPLVFDVVHADTLQGILTGRDSLVTVAQARALLSAPSGQRPRLYGLMFEEGNYQIVSLTDSTAFDRLPIVAQWLSGTTYADLTRSA